MKDLDKPTDQGHKRVQSSDMDLDPCTTTTNLQEERTGLPAVSSTSGQKMRRYGDEEELEQEEEEDEDILTERLLQLRE